MATVFGTFIACFIGVYGITWLLLHVVAALFPEPRRKPYTAAEEVK